MAEKLFFMCEQRKWFLEVESTPGKEAVNVVEMTTKDLEHPVNLVDNTMAGLKGLTSMLKKVLTLVKGYKTACCREIVCEDKSKWSGKLHCCSILTKCWSDAVAQACNPSTLEGRGKQIA